MKESSGMEHVQNYLACGNGNRTLRLATLVVARGKGGELRNFVRRSDPKKGTNEGCDKYHSLLTGDVRLKEEL